MILFTLLILTTIILTTALSAVFLAWLHPDPADDGAPW